MGFQVDKDGKFIAPKGSQPPPEASAYQQQWQNAVNKAAQATGKSAEEISKSFNFYVVQEGDSQWQIAQQAHIPDEAIPDYVVGQNVQFQTNGRNPDLIYAGEVVLIPKTNTEPEGKPGSDEPAGGLPPPTTENTKPEEFAKKLAGEPDEGKRSGLIEGYITSSKEPKNTASELLTKDYGNNNPSVRQKIVSAYISKVAGGDRSKQQDALKDLAQVDWKVGDKNIDVQIDTDIYEAAKKLNFKFEDIPSLNKDVKH